MTGLRRVPWVRRFGVLLNFPSVAAAVFASALILGVSAAAGPLFESSVAASVVQLGLSDTAGVVLSVSARVPLAGDIVAYQEGRLRAALERVPGVGPARATLSVAGLVARAGGASASHAGRVQLIARTGFLEHVAVLSNDEGVRDGVWLAESTSGRLDVGPGDEIVLGAGARTVVVPVAGVYRDLFVGEQDPFWAPLAAEIYPATDDEPPPPPPLLADEEEFLRLTTTLQSFGLATWETSLPASERGSVGYDAAARTAAAVRRLVRDVATPATPVGAALQAPSTTAPFLGVVRDARVTRDSVAGPLRTFSVAGAVAALVGMLAASVYGVRRRRTEVRMLDALGMSTAAYGARSAVEAVLPVVLGGTAGWAAARAAIAAAGPSPSIDASASGLAIAQAAAASLLAVLVLGLGAASAAGTETRQVAGGRVAAAAMRSPWEVVVLLLAGVALYEILNRGTGPVVAPDGTVRIDAFLLLFPVLFIAGGSGIAVRLLVRGLRGLSRRSARWPVPLYLASRRLSAATRIAVVLTTAASLSVGILAYAGTIGRSLDVATEDKARLGIGSDVSAGVPAELEFPPAGGLSPTNVIHLLATTVPGGRAVTVVGVDPATFERAAFWDPRFSGRSLAELLDAIATPGTALPAILANGSLTGAGSIALGGYDVGLRIVADALAFPGQAAGPTLVVSTPLLQRVLESHGISLGSLGVTYRVWVRGPVARAVSYLEGLGLPPGSIVTSAAFVGAPRFRAISSTFAFMKLLGVLSAVVALIGVVLYLQARQHGRLISYAVSSRMGLSRRAHRAAVFVEIAAILSAAALVGTLFALTAGALLSPWVDPLPAVSPSPSFQPPIALLMLILAGVPATAAVGAAVVQRSTDRASVAEALRYAG